MHGSVHLVKKSPYLTTSSVACSIYEMGDKGEIKFYGFGPFTLEVTTRRLWRDGQTIPLTAKLFDILLLLVRNQGQVVTKKTLFNEVWSDTYVEENNLTVAVSALRKTLGESRKEREYIETVPKRGYRFVALVREINNIRDAQGDQIATTAHAVTGVAKSNDTINSLAVLPLLNVGNNPDLDYLSDGITESLINCFSKLPQLRVMARSTVFRYKGKAADPRQVGRELRVGAVLTGSILKLDDQIVIGVELVDVNSGTQLWGEQYKLKFSNILDMQERIINEVSNNLRLRLTLEEKARVHTKHTVSSKAYRLYLKGRYFLGKRIETNITKAVKYFQQAISEDPDFVQAHAGIADCYALLGSYGAMPESKALVKAKPEAERALELNANLAEAHASLGFIKSYCWEWSEAEKHFERAIQLQPSYLQAHHWYSLLLMWQGRFEQSQRELEYSLQISPLSPHVSSSWGVFFYFTRQYDLAITWCRESLELDPSFYPAYAALGLAYLEKGMHKEAIEAHRSAFKISKDPEALSMLGYTYARANKEAEAIEVLNRLDELSNRRYIKPYHFAIIYIGLGEVDRAFDYLEEAFEDKNDLVVVINVDPRFDTIRSDPRSIRLMRKMALPEP